MVCKQSPCEKDLCDVYVELRKLIGNIDEFPLSPDKAGTVENHLKQLYDLTSMLLEQNDFQIVGSLDEMKEDGRLYVLRSTKSAYITINGSAFPISGSDSAPAERDPLYTADKPTIQKKTDVRLQGIDTTGGVIESILDIDGDVNFLHEYITTINMLVSERLADLQDTDTVLKNDLIQSINDRILLEEIFDVRIKNLEKTNIGGEILTTNQGESFTDALDRMIPEPTENQLAYISDGNELRLYQNKGAIVGDTYIIDWQLIHTFGASTVAAGISSEEANARFVDKGRYNSDINTTNTSIQQLRNATNGLETSLNGKQPKTDPNLATASKDTTGSINEVLEIAKKTSMTPMEISVKPDGSYYTSESELPTPSENEVGKIYVVPLGEGYGIDYYLYTSQYNQQTKQYTYNRYKIPYLKELGTWLPEAFNAVTEVPNKQPKTLETPLTGYTATDVEGTLSELDSKKQNKAISLSGITATDVEGALVELAGKGGGTTFKHIVESATDNTGSITINIGSGIAGNQEYGYNAKGFQSYGYGAVGVQYYGKNATGSQDYGANATGSQTYAHTAWDRLGSNAKIEFYFGKQLKTIYSEQDPQTHFATSTNGSIWTNTTHTADAMIKHLDAITGTSPASPIDIENQIFEDLETESKTLVGAMNEILHMVKTLQGK